MSERKVISRSKRLPIQLLVDFKNTDFKGNYFIENLSGGGLFIETTKPLPIGTILKIKFVLPHNRKEYEIAAKVAWNRMPKLAAGLKVGMGIAFVDMEGESEKHLIEAINQYEDLLR